MTISELYYFLMTQLDKVMSVEFTFLDVTFTLWGFFLTGSLLTFLSLVLFSRINKDYSV